MGKVFSFISKGASGGSSSKLDDLTGKTAKRKARIRAADERRKDEETEAFQILTRKKQQQAFKKGRAESVLG